MNVVHGKERRRPRTMWQKSFRMRTVTVDVHMNPRLENITVIIVAFVLTIATINIVAVDIV